MKLFVILVTLFLSKVISRFYTFTCKLHTKYLFWFYDVNFTTYKCYGKPYLRIDRTGSLEIDDNVTLTSGSDFNVIGGDTRLNILIGKSARLKLGKNVGISNSTIVCRISITIEDNVLIGGGCKIYDTDFHSVRQKERLNPYLNKTPDLQVNSSAVTIKKGAWIGGHVIILKGVTVGQNSIVGAGSVVSKDIPPNQIWAGNPARFIKEID